MFSFVSSVSKWCFDRPRTISETPATPATPPRANFESFDNGVGAARDGKKRQASAVSEKLDNARLAKKTKEGEIALRRQLFPEDFPEPKDSDIFSVPDATVMLHAMKRMDEGWKKAKIIKCSGSSHQRITAYHEVWMESVRQFGSSKIFAP